MVDLRSLLSYTGLKTSMTSSPWCMVQKQLPTVRFLVNGSQKKRKLSFLPTEQHEILLKLFLFPLLTELWEVAYTYTAHVLHNGRVFCKSNTKSCIFMIDNHNKVIRVSRNTFHPPYSLLKALLKTCTPILLKYALLRKALSTTRLYPFSSNPRLLTKPSYTHRHSSLFPSNPTFLNRTSHATSNHHPTPHKRSS